MTANLSGAPSPSPFHDYWASRSVSNAWSQDGRMTVPLTLTDAADETSALGTGLGFADISSRTATEISGADTAAFLSALAGDREDAFAPGQTRAAVWCDADGFARGSGRVAMRTADEAVLISAIDDRHWLDAAAGPFGVALTHVAAAGLRLAGTNVDSALDAAGALHGTACDVTIPGLGPVLALPVTGGGYDLWTEPAHATALAWFLEGLSARPTGSRAMWTWNVQAGLIAPGRDWTPVQWALSPQDLRTREQLLAGHYALAAWNGTGRPAVRPARYWPATGLWLAVMWLPPQPGRVQSPPQGWTVAGRTATD
jgi:glycine cleavage system aminomethyltransferase T